MKFTKKYEDYMQRYREKGLPLVGLKKHKKILKACRREIEAQQRIKQEMEIEESYSSVAVIESKCDNKSSGYCPVCDGTFFPSLLQEISAVVGSFNESAKKLLEMRLYSSGFKKYVMYFFGNLYSSHGSLIQEVKDLVAYAIINSIAMPKILKKYDKMHHSTKGQAFKIKAQSLHIEILQSPWLWELMAFYINLRKSKVGYKDPIELFGDLSLRFDDDKLTLSSCLFESMQVEINLTCPICLDMVFDAVSLSCGHIFCYKCGCSAASVTTIDGLEVAAPNKKCPLCRREGVYPRAMHLHELNILLRQSCPEEWEKRRQIERIERIRQAKEHWDFQCRAFVGI